MTARLALFAHPWSLILYGCLIGLGFSIGLWVRLEPSYPTAADPSRGNED